MKEDSTVISFDNVMMQYEDSVPIFKNLSLSFKKQSFCLLIGASGAGKSTFMKLLYGAIRPSSGTLKIFDQDISTTKNENLYLLRQKIGVVFQDFNLLDHLTILENVAIPLKVIGIPLHERERQAKDILDWVDLGGYYNSYPEKLSGGQKQRVAIARAVIARPEILLADEPTGNVDDEIAKKLMGLFYGMHKIGTCVIVATHSHPFKEKFPHRELQIKNGQIFEKTKS